MSNRTWMIVGCIADFVTNAGGAISGAMAQAGGVVMPTPPVFLLGLVLGLVGVAGHLKAVYLQPPGGSGVGGVRTVVGFLLSLAAGWVIGRMGG